MIKKIFTLGLFAFFLSACQNSPIKDTYQLEVINKPTMIDTNTTPTVTPAITPAASPSSAAKVSDSITAIFKTSKGDITIELFPKAAPKTVANFVGLAKGTKDWTSPKTGDKMVGKSLYAGTIFHRVIPDFMIQGGDPLGQGIGGPGYKFEDEFNNGYDFSEPYMLAMANSGSNTNGSQFFITVAPTTWLNNKHTIFGKVIKGTEIVDAISTVKTSSGDKPVEAVILSSVEINEK
jgi:peptidyl-prolyl cis-trans isomerase A (cyclophilin A)